MTPLLLAGYILLATLASLPALVFGTLAVDFLRNRDADRARAASDHRSQLGGTP